MWRGEILDWLQDYVGPNLSRDSTRRQPDRARNHRPHTFSGISSPGTRDHATKLVTGNAYRTHVPVLAAPVLSRITPAMRVILAQPRGYCAGVVRAIEIVERALKKYGPPVYVRHEIVHNRHVVDGLRAKGARFVEELSEVPPGAVTIFSAHGVSRSVEDEADGRGLAVLDATCPLVSKVHSQGQRYIEQGRTVVLIGHAGHPEVEGTMGQLSGPVQLIQRIDDVAKLDIPEDAEIAYITQTTLSVDDTKNVIAALKERFPNVIGPETRDICYATQNRQMAVRELARQVDTIIVVGASNSSNSNRLREIGEECGVPSYLVADGSEVRPEWIAGKHTIGLTAGASAPDVLVDDVIDTLRRHGPVEISTLVGVEEKIQFKLPAVLAAAAD
jgi:4-hydroxy-3-methylbut-2-enyl diphosphate reductase